MIIGLDLDNTIINYERSFLLNAKKIKLISSNFEGTKKDIKSIVINKKHGNYKWEKLQGLVYGKSIYDAKIYNGLKSFLEYFSKNNQIYIISHKTIFAHHDKNHTPLRESAINFLKERKIICPKSEFNINNLIFCNTLNEKVNKIKEKECDIFVDDLEKVFNSNNFPNKCLKILFTPSQKNSQFSSWFKIKNEVISIKKNIRLFK